MMSPRERYLNDAQFRALVDVMLFQIEQANFTPTEIREAAMLAAIIYSQTHVTRYFVPIPHELRDWMEDERSSHERKTFTGAV